MDKAILGTFTNEDDLIDAAGRLRQSGYDRLTIMSPIRLEEVEEVLEVGKSPVRRYSLAGALIGAAGGFAMATASAMAFILPTGGRPIITIPPFLVITYEMTILLGVLFTLLGFHVVSRLPAWHDAPYKTDYNVDRFAVLVDGDPDKLGAAEEIMRASGAETVDPAEV